MIDFDDCILLLSSGRYKAFTDAVNDHHALSDEQCSSLYGAFLAISTNDSINIEAVEAIFLLRSEHRQAMNQYMLKALLTILRNNYPERNVDLVKILISNIEFKSIDDLIAVIALVAEKTSDQAIICELLNVPVVEKLESFEKIGSFFNIDIDEYGSLSDGAGVVRDIYLASNERLRIMIYTWLNETNPSVAAHVSSSTYNCSDERQEGGPFLLMYIEGRQRLESTDVPASPQPVVSNSGPADESSYSIKKRLIG